MSRNPFHVRARRSPIHSAFLQQRRRRPGQTEARSRQRRCGTQLYVHGDTAGSGLFGAGDVQDGVDQHHQSQSQYRYDERRGCCCTGADAKRTCHCRFDADPFDGLDTCRTSCVESLDFACHLCRERWTDTHSVGTRRSDGVSTEKEGSAGEPRVVGVAQGARHGRSDYRGGILGGERGACIALLSRVGHLADLLQPTAPVGIRSTSCLQRQQQRVKDVAVPASL